MTLDGQYLDNIEQKRNKINSNALLYKLIVNNYEKDMKINEEIGEKKKLMCRIIVNR